ncbi:MAG: leucine-rich repeat protein [Bacteroidales bacterium]|nr:leucine-rich repeat protein [Candidatus Colicola caccequi]
MRKIFSLFAALTLSVGLWAANSVITFTSTGKLRAIPDVQDLEWLLEICEEDLDCDDLNDWKNQHPEFQDLTLESFLQLRPIAFNPNAFLDANDQVLTFTIDYDESTHAGTITVNGELVKIAYQAFEGCTGLTSITLPEGVTSIDWNAFYECTGLTSITLPESVTSITDQAFSGCTALTSITIPEGVTSIRGSVFMGCTGLTSITLPEGVTSIGVYAFFRCTALTSITLPESVTSIDTYGFYKCPLSSVTIPANVTYLGTSAFGENSSLTDVYVAWTTTLPTLQDNDIFSGSSIGTATLHVPAGSKALYQDADVWKNFGSIYDVQATKDDAIAAVNAEIAESDNDNVKAIATSAVTAINAATTEAEIYALKDLAIANIASAKAAYTAGDAAGYQRAQDELPTEGTSGPAITITKGDKTVIFYNTDKVEYSIVDAD